MTIKEFYAQIGEDDQDVVKRLGSEALIRRLILKFPQDETFAALQEALEQQNTETACRAAHTLKGVAVNLGFTRLYHAAAALTEVLREAKLAEAAPLLAETETAYRKIINAISALTSD